MDILSVLGPPREALGFRLWLTVLKLRKNKHPDVLYEPLQGSLCLKYFLVLNKISNEAC